MNNPAVIKISFLISFLFMVVFTTGCKKETCNPVSPTNGVQHSFEINFMQYSENNYFLDTAYADTTSGLNLFNKFYGNIIPIVNPNYTITDIELYISANTIEQGQNAINAIAYINLPSRTSSQLYSDSIRFNNIIIPGKVESARFRLLNLGSEYIFHPHTGYITFLIPIHEPDVIAAAYKVQNNPSTLGYDNYYGEFMSELVNNSKSKGVLKLIKPTNLQPNYKEAWKLKMKNFYQIDSGYFPVRNINLDIFLKKSDGTETNTINGKRILELFGFDKTDEKGNLGSDGNFDFRIGYTFDQETEEIIFPVLQPFGKNIPPDLNEFKYQGIYDTSKTYAEILAPKNSFIIKGTYESDY